MFKVPHKRSGTESQRFLLSVYQLTSYIPLFIYLTNYLTIFGPHSLSCKMGVTTNGDERLIVTFCLT